MIAKVHISLLCPRRDRLASFLYCWKFIEYPPPGCSVILKLSSENPNLPANESKPINNKAYDERIRGQTYLVPCSRGLSAFP